MIQPISDQDIVATAERMVLAGLPKRVSDSALARAIGILPQDLQRAFRAVRRQPIYTALQELRLDEADRQLREDVALPADVAALRCGFGHFGVFRRGYKRRFGHEPGASTPAAHPLEGEAEQRGPAPG